VFGELLFERAEVFDDAVVHERHDVVAADVRMCVLIGRRAVRRPTRVAQADRAADRLLMQLGGQVGDAAGRLRDGELAAVVEHDAAAVITAVLEPA
jgi:hypothetical protein